MIQKLAPLPSLEEAIRLRAYELYLERGAQNDGGAEKDWIRAEREILGSSKESTSALEAA